MKNLLITSIVISSLFLSMVVYFAKQENSLRYKMYEDWQQNNYSDNLYSEIKEMSFTSSLISLPFILFYIVTFNISFKHLQTRTSKVLNILGITFSGLVLLIDLIPIIDPGNMSFEELSYLLISFILAALSFNIVNLIQTTRKETSHSNQNTVDDIL